MSVLPGDLLASDGSIAEDGCAGQGPFLPSMIANEVAAVPATVSKPVPRKAQLRNIFQSLASKAIAGKLTNQLDRVSGLGRRRVA